MKTIFFNKTSLFLVAFGAALCLLPLNISAQWTDSGTFITTDDKVGINIATPTAKLQVNLDDSEDDVEGFRVNSPHGNTVIPYTNGWSYLSGKGLIFRTNVNNERMRITTAGRVGIHTTTPTGKLHVQLNSNETNVEGLRVNSPHGNTVLPYTNGWSYLSGKGLIFRTNGNNERMRITTSGKVGIHTPAPTGKLHVQLNSNETNVEGLRVNSPHGNTVLPFSNGWSYLSGKGLIFRTNGNNERMRVTTDGNVGIGTTTPGTFKLAVNGTIRAKEIVVEEGWSDYVFYDNYQLPTLKEEKVHIKENGHLLGFESAEDMAGEIQLGDVTKRQQAKIEEMMLHLIDLKEEVERLKKQIAEK